MVIQKKNNLPSDRSQSSSSLGLPTIFFKNKSVLTFKQMSRAPIVQSSILPANKLNNYKKSLYSEKLSHRINQVDVSNTYFDQQKMQAARILETTLLKVNENQLGKNNFDFKRQGINQCRYDRDSNKEFCLKRSNILLQNQQQPVDSGTPKRLKKSPTKIHVISNLDKEFTLRDETFLHNPFLFEQFCEPVKANQNTKLDIMKPHNVKEVHLKMDNRIARNYVVGHKVTDMIIPKTYQSPVVTHKTKSIKDILSEIDNRRLSFTKSNGILSSRTMDQRFENIKRLLSDGSYNSNAQAGSFDTKNPILFNQLRDNSTVSNVTTTTSFPAFMTTVSTPVQYTAQRPLITESVVITSSNDVYGQIKSSNNNDTSSNINNIRSLADSCSTISNQPSFVTPSIISPAAKQGSLFSGEDKTDLFKKNINNPTLSNNLFDQSSSTQATFAKSIIVPTTSIMATIGNDGIPSPTSNNIAFGSISTINLFGQSSDKILEKKNDVFVSPAVHNFQTSLPVSEKDIFNSNSIAKHEDKLNNEMALPMGDQHKFAHFQNGNEEHKLSSSTNDRQIESSSNIIASQSGTMPNSIFNINSKSVTSTIDNVRIPVGESAVQNFNANIKSGGVDLFGTGLTKKSIFVSENSAGSSFIFNNASSVLGSSDKDKSTVDIQNIGSLTKSALEVSNNNSVPTSNMFAFGKNKNDGNETNTVNMFGKSAPTTETVTITSKDVNQNIGVFAFGNNETIKTSSAGIFGESTNKNRDMSISKNPPVIITLPTLESDKNAYLPQSSRIFASEINKDNIVHSSNIFGQKALFSETVTPSSDKNVYSLQNANMSAFDTNKSDDNKASSGSKIDQKTIPSEGYSSSFAESSHKIETSSQKSNLFSFGNNKNDMKLSSSNIFGQNAITTESIITPHAESSDKKVNSLNSNMFAFEKNKNDDKVTLGSNFGQKATVSESLTASFAESSDGNGNSNQKSNLFTFSNNKNVVTSSGGIFNQSGTVSESFTPSSAETNNKTVIFSQNSNLFAFGKNKNDNTNANAIINENTANTSNVDNSKMFAIGKNNETKTQTNIILDQSSNRKNEMVFGQNTLASSNEISDKSELFSQNSGLFSSDRNKIPMGSIFCQKSNEDKNPILCTNKSSSIFGQNLSGESQVLKTMPIIENVTEYSVKGSANIFAPGNVTKKTDGHDSNENKSSFGLFGSNTENKTNTLGHFKFGKSTNESSNVSNIIFKPSSNFVQGNNHNNNNVGVNSDVSSKANTFSSNATSFKFGSDNNHANSISVFGQGSIQSGASVFGKKTMEAAKNDHTRVNTTNNQEPTVENIFGNKTTNYNIAFNNNDNVNQSTQDNKASHSRDRITIKRK